MNVPHRSAPSVPPPLAKTKAPSLIQELRNYAAEPLASEQAAAISATKCRLWLIACSAVMASAISIARQHPEIAIPTLYLGGSTAIALSTGAAIENTRQRTHSKIASTLVTARPLGSVSSRWQKTEERQLKKFDELVSQHLFNDWVAQQPQTITVEPLAPLPAQVQCPAKDLGENPQSALIGGVPGAGKGVFYLLALHHLKQHHHGIKVMLINPKNSPKESGTAKAPALVMSRDFENSSPDESALWLWDCVEQFQRWDGPKLLIIDEMASIMATLKLSKSSLQIRPKFLAFLQHITSMGDSERKYLWLISQDCSSDGLGISGAIRATLRAIAIIAPHNRQALSAFLAGRWLPSPEGGRAELDAIMQSSEVGRAIFDGKVGHWLPMPKMRNLTGWNRDAGESTSASTPPKKSAPSYLEQWQDWLRDRDSSSCTVREACQRAPRQIRGKADAVKQVFAQLERIGTGTFDPIDGVFELATVASCSQA